MKGLWVVLTVLGGFAAYWVRCRWRLAYGIGEVITLVGVVFVTFFPPRNAILSGYSSGPLAMLTAVEIRA
jgi:hypothetical protein